MIYSDRETEEQENLAGQAEAPASEEQAESIVLSAEEFASLQTQLADYKAQAQSHWDKALRALSELENMRKRTEREIAHIRKFAIESLVRELLPVLDSLEQGLAAEQANHAKAEVMEGLALTLKMLQQVLEKFSVQTIDPQHEPFDPTLHEAMSMQKEPSLKPGTVLMVFQKGYQLYDRVLRPARVVVVGDPVS